VVGPRRSSVFMTPVRDALLAPDHACAVRINRGKAGEASPRKPTACERGFWPLTRGSARLSALFERSTQRSRSRTWPEDHSTPARRPGTAPNNAGSCWRQRASISQASTSATTTSRSTTCSTPPRSHGPRAAS
jgi:hypothetical protein